VFVLISAVGFVSAAAMGKDDALSVYADILQAFRDYETSGWKKYDNPLIADSWLVLPQADPEIGMKPEEWDGSLSGAGYDINNARVVYSLRDLNGDGAPELLIGVAESTDDDSFYSLFGVYTVTDGKAKSVFQRGDARESVTLYQDGTIGSAWEMDGMGQENRYSLAKDGTLVTEYRIGRDPKTNDDGEMILDENDEYVFEYADNSGPDDEEGKPLTKEEAEKIFDRYSKDEAELEWQGVTAGKD
jgi:hypothetical protein